MEFKPAPISEILSKLREKEFEKPIIMLIKRTMCLRAEKYPRFSPFPPDSPVIGLEGHRTQAHCTIFNMRLEA